MLRTLQPELLDSLPHDHPDALHSRRDLRLINQLMGNYRWVMRTLRRRLRNGERVLELGAGHGELGRRLHWLGVPSDGLDVVARPLRWPRERAWHVADLRQFEGYASYDAVVANLILHQFSDADLAALGERLNRSPRLRLLVANEPLRSRRGQWLFSIISPLLGMGHVTRHDARVSIAAGFLGEELPRLLGLDAGQWTWRCTTISRGGYRMIATRRA